MVVGILTAKRDPPTVIRMAKELVAHVSMEDYKMVVRISTSASHDEEMIKQLAALGFTIHANNQSYPELAPDKVQITFNDPLQRVLWRTSHGMFSLL